MNQIGADGFVSDFLRPAIFAACGNACIPPEATATIVGLVIRPGNALLRWRGNPFARTYDVAARRPGGAWRTLATRLVTTTYRLHGTRGARMQARVRARDDTGLPGACVTATGVPALS